MNGYRNIKNILVITNTVTVAWAIEWWSNKFVKCSVLWQVNALNCTLRKALGDKIKHKLKDRHLTLLHACSLIALHTAKDWSLLDYSACG